MQAQVLDHTDVLDRADVDRGIVAAEKQAIRAENLKAMPHAAGENPITSA